MTFSRPDYDLDRYYQRKKEAVRYLGGKCVVCGTIEMLEFDHVDPATKTYNVTLIMLHSDDRLYDELDKCQLLCHTCHKEKTKLFHIDHGGGLGGIKGCKCIPCKARKAEYMRYWKKYGAMTMRGRR